MISDDYNFTKFFLGSTNPEDAVSSLLTFLDKRCNENGLEAVDKAEEAHFVFLAVSSKDRWLHFDSKGHYLPLNTTTYIPVVPDLTNWKPSITCWVRRPDSYTLRLYKQEDMRAAYANLNSGNRFESLSAAEDWVPVFEDWKPYLNDRVTEEEFYHTLPMPDSAEGIRPNPSVKGSDLPELFAYLFGWDKRLNLVATSVPAEDGVGYRSEAGDYYDEESGLRTLVRCYAHPDPRDFYHRHWAS